MLAGPAGDLCIFVPGYYLPRGQNPKTNLLGLLTVFGAHLAIVVTTLTVVNYNKRKITDL